MYSKPIILKECFPLHNLDDLMDDGLRNVAQNWIDLCATTGGIPVWSMDFAMQNASVVSRAMLYDTSGDDIYITMIGDQCREFIGLEKTKGELNELIPKVNADDIRKRIEVCAEQRAPNYCLKSMSWNHDRSFIKYEVLFLPFTSDTSDECTWFLTVMVFHVDEEISV